jgi:hypothetical protein
MGLVDQISGLYQAQSAGFIGVSFQPAVAARTGRQPRRDIKQVRSPPENMMDLIGIPAAGDMEAGTSDHGTSLTAGVKRKKFLPQPVVFPKIPGALG